MNHIIRKIRSHLNTFDILVIFGLLLILGTLLFFRLSRKEEFVPVRIKLSNDTWWWQGNPPDYWLVQGLSVGQKTYNTFGRKVAEITDLHIYDLGSTKRLSFVDINLAASFDKRRQVFLYNFQPLQIGKPIDLVFGKTNIHGLVTYIGGDAISYQEKEIEVKLFAVHPFEANSYKVGLQAKDSQNRVLAQIESVEAGNAQTYEFFDEANRRFVIKGVDPTRRDVTLRLKIKTILQNGAYYYVDGAAVKVGEEIWFQFPQTVAKKAIVSKIIK